MLLTVEKREFLFDLIDIINALGTPVDDILLLGQAGNGLVYEDSLLKIVSIRGHTYFVVTRKNSNMPVIIMENDISIRFHGEYIYLREHVINLLKQIKKG